MKKVDGKTHEDYLQVIRENPTSDATMEDELDEDEDCI
jgi:hypothetical protein